MEEGLPDQDSEQAADGTLLHALDCYGQTSPEWRNSSQNQRDLLLISAELDAVIFQRVTEQFNIPADELFEEGRETELWVHRGIKKLIPGHCDRWRFYLARKLLVVIDKKFGYKIVTDASANYQLRTYAVAGSEHWGAADVVVAITQPRLSRDERLTLSVYDEKAIDASRTELLAIWHAAKAPDAPLVAGNEQCRYCKAKLLCDAYKAKFLSVAEGINRTTKATAERSLAECSDDQLDQILVAIQFADFIKDQAREEARARVADGRMAGWKLGKESEIREITDAITARAVVVGSHTLSDDEWQACCAPSIKKIEDKIREKTGGTWKEAKDATESLLADLIERKPKKASIVREKT